MCILNNSVYVLNCIVNINYSKAHIHNFYILNVLLSREINRRIYIMYAKVSDVAQGREKKYNA